MEPHREVQQKAPESGAGQKPKRFRIVKLEERIAPKHGQSRTIQAVCNSYGGGCGWLTAQVNCT